MATFGEMLDRNVKEARKKFRFSVQLSVALWEILLDIFKRNKISKPNNEIGLLALGGGC